MWVYLNDAKHIQGFHQFNRNLSRLTRKITFLSARDAHVKEVTQEVTGINSYFRRLT